ncbi:MAG TPA: sigma-70 family RNA polymerase sigma factor [Acidimicrobiales bacterium]|nr:sigma-70 family RNA polymerase sigma factor [Acidimicrobiales bacterium]
MAEDPRRLAAAAYRELAPAVLGYLRSQRVADPEDVLGEVFLQVARDVGRFSGDDAALRRWVFSIAHNRSMDAHRRAKRDRSTLEAEISEGRSAPTDAPAEPVDRELIDALATLSDEQREVVVLRFVADLPLEAVAKITGRTPGAVKAMQHRAMDNLRKAVSPDDQ